MNDAIRPGQPRLLEALIKSSQYFARLKTQQDVWEHLSRFVLAYFPAQWVAIAERDAAPNGVALRHCTLDDSHAPGQVLTEEVLKLIAEVLDSGFLACQVLRTPAASMTAFIPIVEERQPGKIMLVGHRTADPLPKELLDLYLAIAGLAGTAFERLNNERELRRHRGHLEELVKERTAQLAQAKRHNELILHSVAEGICGMDLEGRITFINPSAARLLAWEAHELIGRDAHATFHHTHSGGETYPRAACPVHWTLEHGKASHAIDEEFLRRDGSRFPVEFTVTPVLEAGQVVGAVMVFRDITERKQAEAQLRAAKTAVEQASAAKDQFIATLSHELRTPLTPVLAAAGSILQDAHLPHDLREDLELIHRNVGLEVALISDLLDVTRIAAGKLVLNKRPVDVAQVLRDAARISSVDLDGRSQTLTIETPAEPYPMEADAARLHQVFWNLTKNAIKFSPHGGRIAIRATVRAQTLQVTVSDSGIGIEPALLPRLFNHFQQGEAGTTRSFGGLGLGLAISKAVVEMHGGRIAAASEGKNRGATFTVELPLQPDLRDQLPASASAHRPQTACAKASPRTCPCRPLKILLVEDHADTAKLMARLLAAQGHTVLKADSVQAALAAAQAQDPDLIISDLGLPDGTGHDLLRRLLAAGCSAKAIALSGYGTLADVQKSLEVGFREHLTKPVNFDALQDAVRRAAAG